MQIIPTKLAVITACGYAALAAAQPITFNVDIGAANRQYVGLAIAPDPAGGTNWNNMAIGGTVPFTISNIVSSVGVPFPSVNVTMYAAGNTMHYFDASSPTVPNPLDLMRDYSFFRTYTVSVSGLEAGNYEMYFYGHGDQENQAGVLRIAAPYGAYTNATATNALSRDIYAGGLGIAYLHATNLTVGSSGLFTFTVVNYMNGFQLRPAQPEGPAFVVTGTDGCSDVGVTPGLTGSVSTNDYLLYFNGTYIGPTVAGTGSALNFPLQTNAGTYTIVATNPATATSGLMYGSVRVYLPGVAINTQPASASVVSNLPASFTVQAAGDSLTYQWYKSGVALTNGGTVSGAQTPTLSISAVQPGDAASYEVVVQNPCSGAGVTSSPPAVLTVTAPRSLIWAGGNPGSSWNFADLEFLLSGSPSTFAEGDNVTFDDSSSFQSVVISNNMTPTMVSVTGTKSYTFSGPNKLIGVARLEQSSSGPLTILNDNDFTGGTVVNSGRTLTLGNGTTTGNGKLSGVLTVAPTATLQYNYNGNGGVVQLKHVLAGSGTNEVLDVSGGQIQTALSGVSSNYTGVVNVRQFTILHAADNNAGYALGNGNTVNIDQDGGQIWLDRSATTYNNVFNIQGSGSPGSSPALGAIRMFGSTITGPINLLANSRIGGSISGGTIRSGISGAYQLEVLGTSPTSFVLQMGPTNGTHSYTDTLITAGIIQAVSTGAISAGPLTIDNAGTLRLNGVNLSVSTLTSLNSGTVAGGGAMVVNNHASTPAVLTVGSAGDTFQYDGYFANGAAGTLGLTKVGAGTFTFTALASNTGPVTVSGGTLALSGSGSFDSALSIITSSGGTYDVTGAIGTLNRTSGKTLRGNGSVSGNVSAAGGSTVHSGLSMGTLAISGSATVNGTYLANLNRTNSPSNCSQITAGGGLTFSGATLAVTNVGPKLQVGDFFQLFPGATAGLTYAPFTNDVPHNAKYTWTDTVSSNGRITVASVGEIINTTPTNVVATVSGSTLTLSWPADYKGWTLQAQTNALGVGLATNWVSVPGSTLITTTNIAINPNTPAVFYRLRYP
jgi:autotransporter-associated beta strand protein